MVIAHSFINANKWLPEDSEWTLVLLSDETICSGRYINDRWDLGNMQTNAKVIGWMKSSERQRIINQLAEEESNQDSPNIWQ